MVGAQIRAWSRRGSQCTTQRRVYSRELLIPLGRSAARAFKKPGDRIRELVDGKNVLGVWTYMSTLRQMPDRTWSHDCRVLWFDTKTAEEDALFDQCRRTFFEGVHNLRDLTEVN